MTGKTFLDLRFASLPFLRSALESALGEGTCLLALMSRVSRAVVCRNKL